MKGTRNRNFLFDTILIKYGGTLSRWLSAICFQNALCVLYHK